MNLSILAESLTIERFAPNHPLPPVPKNGFYSLTRTSDELSIVREDPSSEWRALKVQGPLDFSLTGILSSLATTLAEAKVSIFAVSTYDTDYILVKTAQLDPAVKALQMAGHVVSKTT